MSDVIRDAIDLLDRYVEMSDIMETSAANLVDIAEVFDSIDGPTSPIYAQAIREAAALLLMFCYNAGWGYDGEKIVFRAKSPTKSKRGKKMIRETEVTIRSTDGLPLIRDAEGPQEATGQVVALSPETVKTAQEAAQAAGEGLTQFITQAIESRATLDKRKRSNTGKGPGA